MVTDGSGIIRFKLDNVDINSTTLINLQGYVAGVYNVKCTINGALFTKHLVLINL